MSVVQDEQLLDTEHQPGGPGLPATPPTATSGHSRPFSDSVSSPERQNRALLWVELYSSKIRMWKSYPRCSSIRDGVCGRQLGLDEVRRVRPHDRVSVPRRDLGELASSLPGL